MEEERPVTVDRDGGRSQGELLGEKAVGRVEAPLIHLGPWEPRRLRPGEARHRNIDEGAGPGDSALAS